MNPITLYQFSKRLNVQVEPQSNMIVVSNNRYIGGVLAPNGKIYFAPDNASQILELSGVDSPNVIGTDTSIPSNLSNLPTSNYNKYYNKF